MSVPQEPATILIIDDSPANVRLLQAYLRPTGYHVEAVSDPTAALETALRVRPDLILLDVVMPMMDGYSICRALRAHEETRLVAVVLVTVLNAPEARIAGLEAGADDFLSRPIDRVELLARVRSLVRLRRLVQAQREHDRQRAALEKTLAIEHVRWEEEARRKAFYRDVICAVTGGKLHLVERDELAEAAGPAETVTEGAVRDGNDLGPARESIACAAAEAGIAPTRANDLVLCAGEALTNALRYAGGATVQVRRAAAALQVWVVDHGRGIDSRELPRATLMRGYSSRKPSLGHGFTLMLELLDRVCLATDSEGTTIVLEMRLQPPSLDEELDALLGN
ncbi:MAG: response regulator [Armatimonadetes bacterium]|jgi:DNA-binding response OmpR family regulator/anti-sigma regulatory factor (Ser/Thr protein kinase)|nr:response regulator [Armatimonadota bacterium]